MKSARAGAGSRIRLPVVIGVILLWTVVPLAWMLLSSFKPPEDLTASTPTLAFTPTFEHYEAPFAIWIMNAFFSELSPSLEEAALMDGATRWAAFKDIALPLVWPGIATTAILCLVFSWNDYAFAVTFSGPDSQTLPIAASQLVTQTSIDWGQLTSIGTIVVAPMILVGLIVRKWLVTGLTLGAVTGE